MNWEKIRNNSYKRNYYSIKDGKIYYGNEKGDFLETLQKKYDTLVKDIPELWKKYKSFKNLINLKIEAFQLQKKT